MAEVLEPNYYDIEDAVKPTGDNSTLDTALAGTGASVSAFVEELINQLDLLTSSGGSKTLKFLVKSGGNIASNIASQAIAVEFDRSKNEFSVGEVVLDVVGTAAVAAAIVALLPTGGVILALTAGQSAFASSLIWSAIRTASELDEDIINLIDGTIPVDIQLVNQDSNVIGGALFKEGLSEEQELEAVQNLIERTILTSFPNITIGKDRIRVVEKTNFSPREKEYKVYDGKFADAISQELGIGKEELLGLGQKNSPNTNIQIYYESSSFNPKSFVFASDENKFFVPLPDTTGVVAPMQLHPGNIISGSSGSDTLDAFKDRDRDLLFDKQNVLLLGLEGDDIINGNVEDDFIAGGAGNDNIDGGSGEDIVIFSDRFKNYDYSISEHGTITFSHMRGTRKDGVDRLKNIEFARFKDQIVPLPLDEETITRLEDSKDDVTFRLETTVIDTSSPDTSIRKSFPLVLEYSFDPELRPRLSVFGSAFLPIDGVLSIGGQSTSIQNGRLVAGSSSYTVQFVTSDIGGSLFGLELSGLLLFLESDNNNFFNGIPPSKIPTSADFAQLADSYSISARFGGFPEFRSFSGATLFSNSFTLESDGDRNTNNSPIAVDDEISASAGTVVSLPILDLLENDSDPDEDNLIFDGIDNVVNGTIVITDDNIEFAPDAEFTDLASFDYTISDGRVSEGRGLTDTATVTINFIASINEAPVATNDSFRIDEDDVLADNVLLNDNDVDKYLCKINCIF
ncbi:MAG: Ig-like domain-containing protein [Rivularia sp. (in: cyanobacteria)]